MVSFGRHKAGYFPDLKEEGFAMRAAARRVFSFVLRRKLVLLALLSGCAVAIFTVRGIGRPVDRGPDHLAITAVQADAWKHDGRARLAVRSSVRSETYAGGIPETLVIDVCLDTDFQKAWEIWRIDLVEIPTRGPERLVESIQVVDNPASRFHAQEYLTGLHANDCSYAVVVFLHAYANVSEQDVDSAKRTITDGRGVTIKDARQPWSQPTPSLCSRTHSSSPQ